MVKLPYIYCNNVIYFYISVNKQKWSYNLFRGDNWSKQLSFRHNDFTKDKGYLNYY